MRAKVQRSEKKEIIHEGDFVRFIRQGAWEYVERNNCSSVVIIVAMTQEKRVLFVEQYRLPVDKSVIEFPAGLVNDDAAEQDETIYTAAKRELLEETGYEAGEMTKLLEGPVSSGLTSGMVSMVHAKNLKKVGDGGGDELESIIIHEVPLTEVDQWLENMRKKGFLIEPKIYAGLYFLKTLHC